MNRRRALTPARWVLLAVLVVLIVVGVAGAYLLSRPLVTVTSVVEGPVVEAFYSTGTLQPMREYPVRATAAGILRKPPGTQPYVDKGDHVTSGQPLAVVADAQWQAAYDKAKAELDEKRQRAEDATSPVLLELDARVTGTLAQLEIAHREEQRVLHLLNEGGSSQSELDKAIDRIKQMGMESEAYKAQKLAMKLQLQRELQQAEAAVKAAEWDLDQQTLRSPVDGTVLDRPVPLGTRLAVNDHVMQVADVRPAKLVMRAQVDEEDITHVRVGQTVRMVLYAFPGQPFAGTVDKVYDKADPDRRTFEVDVAPNEPDAKFAAGMTGELAFEVRAKEKAMIVPSQAVQDGRIFVLRGRTVRSIAAEVGLKGVERAELTGGVAPGDRVVVSPAAGLRDGQTVREQYMDPAAAAAVNKPKAKELFRGGF